MFGRSRTTATTAPDAPAVQTVAKEGGKGRPTPRRRDVEQANRRPIVGAAPPPGATKEEKKRAKAERREAVRADRARSREAMLSGDERHLPARDRGPARRFARDVVDSRRNAGELFLPIALVSVVCTFSQVPVAMLAGTVLLYGAVLVVGVDAFLLRRRVQRGATERFGEDKARGAGTYAMMRSVQLRRARMPRPQVERGQHPS